jgi:hypothetical protein
VDRYEDVTVYPVEDTSSFLRNPAMGWAVYIDAFEKGFPDAEDYWKHQDPNIEQASILYLRLPWSELEPEEGRYAWLYDVNYQKLIRMALDRKLKLAFRVYVDSKDAYRQAAPQFVFDAGAWGYVNSHDYVTPYLYDPVFQDKFSNFVRAFAAEYDDPDTVDFIDGQGLGWWGEMHNVDYLDKAQKQQVFEWIIHLYSEHFNKVVLGGQYGKNSFEYAMQEWALREKGYMIRRDSFGSPIWLNGEDKSKILDHWPTVPVFAENCYHTFVGRPDWYQGDGFPTLRDMMTKVIEDAKELHANTLDLRIIEDATQWTQAAPDLVSDFALNGGYRFVPNRVTFPRKMESDQDYTIFHSWKNAGVGKLPNNLRNWNYKYKVAFALLDREKERVIYHWIDHAEPSDWIKGSEYTYQTSISLSNVSKGSYTFAVAIVNTAKNCEPEISLAVQNETVNKWVVLGEVNIVNRSQNYV